MMAHMIASFVYDHPDTSMCIHKDALELIDWYNHPTDYEGWLREVKAIVKFYS